MNNFEELRYPFSSAVDFFYGGYWRQLAAFHLLFAWVCIIILSVIIFRQSRHLGQKLLALYFSLTLFNNYCFWIAGVSLADICGILGVLYLAYRAIWRPSTRFRGTYVGGFILVYAAAFSTHAMLISVFYPQLDPSPAGLVRLCLIGKVVTLGLCVLLFRASFSETADVDWLINQIVNFGTIAIACYFIQLCLLVTGHLPYGTFFDAGYIGVPSFGSVSIERGHLGKFLTPLYPFFLLSWLRYGRRWAFLFFCVVTMINFSASSLSYFMGYVLITGWMFRRRFFEARIFLSALLLLLGIAAFIVRYWDVFAAVIEKVINLGIEGDKSGGRNIGVLLEYLRHYPFGISYGGSTLRIAPGLDQIEGGLYPFISQLSFLSIPIIISLTFLVARTIRRSKTVHPPQFHRVLVVGSVMIPIIFAADSLWFVPTIWLPLVVSEQMSSSLQRESALFAGLSSTESNPHGSVNRARPIPQTS